MKNLLTNSLIITLISIPLFGLIFLPNALFTRDHNSIIPYSYIPFLALGTMTAIIVWACTKNNKWINQKGKFARMQIAILVTLPFVFLAFWLIKNFTARYHYVRTTGFMDDEVLK